MFLKHYKPLKVGSSLSLYFDLIRFLWWGSQQSRKSNRFLFVTWLEMPFSNFLWFFWIAFLMFFCTWLFWVEFSSQRIALPDCRVITSPWKFWIVLENWKILGSLVYHLMIVSYADLDVRREYQRSILRVRLFTVLFLFIIPLDLRLCIQVWLTR